MARREVDPFMHPIPAELSQDQETRQYFEYLNRHLHDLWVRSGGGDDYINNLDVSALYGKVSIKDDFKEFNAITKTSSYTAVAFDFIEAKRGAIILLPEFPKENSVVIVANGDGSTIRVKGNGKKINGVNDYILRNRNTTLVFHYFVNSDYWRIR